VLVVVKELNSSLTRYVQDESPQTEEDVESKKLMQQWVVWMFGASPLATYLHTRPRPELPPLMIWYIPACIQYRQKSSGYCLLLITKPKFAGMTKLYYDCLISKQ
jgi:hypothetical protein